MKYKYTYKNNSLFRDLASQFEILLKSTVIQPIIYVIILTYVIIALKKDLCKKIPWAI